MEPSERQMEITIAAERPDTPHAVALIEALDAELIPLYPMESHHGYAVEKLIAQGVAFFVLRVDGEPAGCGGVQLYGDAYAELKRMYVRPDLRGHGLSRRLLAFLEEHARAQGVPLLRLETGIYQHAAIALYEHCGFRRIPPFGAYWDDPVSLCYEKALR
jgi:putative acetyltransferase